MVLKTGCTALVLLLLVACGGGGGSSSSVAVVDQPQSAPITSPDAAGSPVAIGEDDENDADDAMAPIPLRGIAAASRLASRATLGQDYEAIVAMSEEGEDAWLSRQFEYPVGLHDPIVTDLIQRQSAGEFAALEAQNPNIQAAFSRLAWWQQAINAEDQFRQRVALALSEIFVVSDSLNALALYPYAMSNYYDMLLENAFGNFRDLLLDVTLHPSMGVYLSHINNAKADPEANTFPDENYVREVMQLFTIGLFELNADGTEKRDANGNPIPTYNNDDIREFARVFTGLSFGGQNRAFGSRTVNFREPMAMFEAYHDDGEKILLGGTVVPAGQPGMSDIEAAVDNLFNHPNVGPFIGRQLIQRLVMSNPSPAYVERVAAAFNGADGSPRGDMKAMLRAILLDPEALAVPDPEGTGGKLREPLLRVVATLRQLGVSSPDGFYANSGFFVQEQIQQHPLSAPSVFNFFQPGFRPAGEVAEAGLVAPEFQITNSGTVVSISNMVDAAVFGGLVNDLRVAPFQQAGLDLSGYLALADDPDALVDRLDLVFSYQTLSDATREVLLDALEQIDDPETRVQAAIYWLLISPDYAVEL
jgi:uncharacterized protein (DUF1800 family)